MSSRSLTGPSGTSAVVLELLYIVLRTYLGMVFLINCMDIAEYKCHLSIAIVCFRVVPANYRGTVMPVSVGSAAEDTMNERINTPYTLHFNYVVVKN